MVNCGFNGLAAREFFLDGTISAGSLDGMWRVAMYRLAIEAPRVVDCLLLGLSTGGISRELGSLLS